MGLLQRIGAEAEVFHIFFVWLYIGFQAYMLLVHMQVHIDISVQETHKQAGRPLLKPMRGVQAQGCQVRTWKKETQHDEHMHHGCNDSFNYSQ